MKEPSPFITDSQIQYLPSLLSKLQKGDIRIPPFQRPFVWKGSQVLELLESIYKGYPIGTLFFWVPDEPIAERIWSHNFLLTNFRQNNYLPQEVWDTRYPPTYILDGVQRLSSLFGVFNWLAGDTPSQFNIVFDLRNEEFLHFQAKHLPDAYIRLSALFAPKSFFETQRQWESLPDSDTLIERTISLHTKFQECSIPVITIRGGELSSAIEIFERINTGGTHLTFSDLLATLIATGDQKFDGLTETADRLSDNGFHVSPELFTKMLAINLGKSPTPHDILSLREVDSRLLGAARESCATAVTNVKSFLKEELNIHSFEVVPYEEQILILVKLFSISLNPTTETRFLAKRWFWRSGFNESFSNQKQKNIPDLISASDNLMVGLMNQFEDGLELSTKQFRERRLSKARAFSLTTRAMIAAKQPRSLITGEIIDPETFMRDASLENFEGLFPRHELELDMGKHLGSSKLIANSVVVSEFERKQFLSTTPQELINSLRARFGEQEADGILNSQFVSKQVADPILARKPTEFLDTRAFELVQFAKSLTK